MSAPSPLLFRALCVTCLRIVLGRYQRCSLTLFAFVQAYVAEVIRYNLVHQEMINDDTLTSIQAALTKFHHYRDIFQITRVCNMDTRFNLLWQHSLSHYPQLICLFGAPNGLCSSITESKHIGVVKNPYQDSNRCDPLSQMLITNQCIDKLAAACIDFKS